MSEREWCSLNNCDHAHCPEGCEHPQPIVDGERLLCGQCLVLRRHVSEMLPCSTEICDERA